MAKELERKELARATAAAAGAALPLEGEHYVGPELPLHMPAGAPDLQPPAPSPAQLAGSLLLARRRTAASP